MEIFLDTAFHRPIRFRQKVLMVFLNIRWNYSPLKEKAAQVAGRPFRCSNAMTKFTSGQEICNDI
jgi:hypothetical protein